MAQNFKVGDIVAFPGWLPEYRVIDVLKNGGIAIVEILGGGKRGPIKYALPKNLELVRAA